MPVIAPKRRRPTITRHKTTDLFHPLVVDLFAGGGGASLGIERGLGRTVDLALNHNSEAIAMHTANHPLTAHLEQDVWRRDPVEVMDEQCPGWRRRGVGLPWGSPDCRHFSRAKGAKPVSKKIRGLAWVIVKWAKQVSPALIRMENVREFQEWGPLVHLKIDGVPQYDRTSGQPVLYPCKDRKGQTFKRFVGQLRRLGYAVEWRVLDAADYGSPTHRRRLFLIARRDGQPVQWPAPTHGPKRSKEWRPAAECIDWTIPCPSIFDRKRPLAEKTMRRIAMGIGRYVIANPTPFIVNLTHGARVEAIDEPARTITGANRGEKAVIVPTLVQTGYGEREGQAPRTLDITANPKGGGIALAAASMIRMNHGDKQWSGVDEPLSTITAQGNKAGLVYAFLASYYGQGIGQPVDVPALTVTSRDRFGLVTVELAGGERGVVVEVPGRVPHIIVDIGLRMLTPRELARCQGFPEEYVLTGTKTSQVARIENSVCPQVAEAVVRANGGRA